MRGIMQFSCLLLVFTCVFANSKRRPDNRGKQKHSRAHNISTTRSVTHWNLIDEPGKISVSSMSVEHHADSSWHVPSFHDKYSAGWNRTIWKEKATRPYACTVRFYALGLETTLKGYMEGGTGYLGLEISQEVRGKQKKNWHGYDGNELNKVHCYYMTNKNYGSEFIDNPKTLGVAIYCPVYLDQEIGEWEFRKVMESGFFCRTLADNVVKADIFLRPSDFTLLEGNDNDGDLLSKSNNITDLSAKLTRSALAVSKRELKGEVTTAPTAPRLQQLKELALHDLRSNAVCTVQTFRNPQTGPMLYMFTK